MDFRLTDEQQQLRDTLVRLVQKDYTFEKRRAILRSAEGWSRDVWRQLAEMGLTAIGLPEEHGGLGGNAVDTMVVMEVFGRALLVEPYLATVVIGAGLVADGGSEDQKAAILPAVAAGERLLALAHGEPGVRYETARVTTTARAQGGNIVLNGTKTVVLHGAQADTLIVSARTSGGEADPNGVSLFLVERGARGVTIRDYPTHDGQRVADVVLKDVTVSADARLGPEHGALPLIERALARGIAALCAEAVGAMAALVEITLGYIKTRKQFGVPIGSFQVLQHRAADMLIHTEQARSMTYLAAGMADVKDRAARDRAIAAAKTLVGQAARFVGQQAVQLHGGIGVTDEANVSHYFKRLTLINATFGDADHHLGRFSDALLAESAGSAGTRRAA